MWSVLESWNQQTRALVLALNSFKFYMISEKPVIFFLKKKKKVLSKSLMLTAFPVYCCPKGNIL